jgi:hypothetical protein
VRKQLRVHDPPSRPGEERRADEDHDDAHTFDSNQIAITAKQLSDIRTARAEGSLKRAEQVGRTRRRVYVDSSLWLIFCLVAQ